jgi:TRAP-type mannitol/chloroaromatic compound transport system permease large subunit
MGPQTKGGVAIMVLRSFIPPIILITMVLGSILFGLATPTEAAGVGAFGALLLALVNLVILPALGVPDMNFEGQADIDMGDKVEGQTFGDRIVGFWSVLKQVVYRAALTNGMLFGIFIGATLFSFVFRSLGGDDIVIEIVESLGLGSWGLLFLLMGIVFFLGFFFDWIEITLIVLPVFSPIIELLDFGDHLDKKDIVYWFAILLAVNLQTSFLTPPFGFALFYMKAVAPKSIKIQQIYRGIIPFVILQLIGLGMVMAFPQLAMWLPNKLLN